MAIDALLLRDFWRCFTHTATSHSCVLKLVTQRLPEGSKILRAVDSTMRAAVNRTVTALQYAQSHILPGNDLVEVFPEADELDCAFIEPLARTGSPPPIEHVRLALERFATASPRFVRKVRVLKMRFDDSHTIQLAQIVELVAELLPRFTSLEVLEVHVSTDLSFVFRGPGQTPAERRSSMQQQLAAICDSTSFLAPPSWPTSQCLTTLNLDCRMADIQPSVLLSAALQTVSLSELGLTFDDALSAEDCASLQQLSNLTSLTQLTIHGALEETAPAGLFQTLLTAAAQATSLRQLEVTGTSDATMNDGVGHLALGQLPHLTRLLLGGTGLEIDLPALSAAHALKELNLTECASARAPTSLFSLTSLTSLEGPVFRQPPEEGAGAAAVRVPAAWREGLLVLGWQCFYEQGTWPRMVPQLTCLTKLSLNEVRVSPAFCRMLSKLPRLAELALFNASAAESIPTAPSEELRSLLPALAAVSLACCSAATLYTLALWTRLRDDGVALDVALFDGPGEDEDTAEWCTVVVKVWSVGWLRSMLRCMLDNNIFMLAFVVIDDGDVLALNAAGAGLRCPASRYMGVLLGEKVSLGALQQLQVSTRLHVRDELPEEVKGQADGWTAALTLTPDRFLALVRPFMDQLNIDDGSLVDDGAFQEMASQAVGLTYLQVGKAARLSDAALWKLCSSCPRLEELLLSDPSRVTAAGLLPLLTTHRALSKVVLEPAQGVRKGLLPFAGLLAGLEALHPRVHDMWVVMHKAPGPKDKYAAPALHITRQA